MPADQGPVVLVPSSAGNSPACAGEGADIRAGRGGTGLAVVQADQDRRRARHNRHRGPRCSARTIRDYQAGTVELFHVRHRAARERAWWDSYAGQVNPAYLKYVGYEAGAVSIRQFQNSLVPGLLQTPGTPA